MREGRRVGRPRSASREMLEEAACELFLEQGYAATSVADITQRAGVSRATFFNYISAKSDLLWTSVDDALDALTTDLTAPTPSPAPAPPPSTTSPPADSWIPHARRGPAVEHGVAVAEVRAALLRRAARLEPGTVVLAFANAEPMGVAEELEESAARRQRRAAAVIGGYLRRRGTAELESEVIGAALAGAFLAALRAWARSRPARTSLPDVLARALDAVSLG